MAAGTSFDMLVVGGGSAGCVPEDMLDARRLAFRTRGRPTVRIDNLTILADALVDRVVLAGDRVIGVATTAGDLRAQSVVLAAGAYGSPGILLRRGVGPERELPGRWGSL